MDRPLRDRTPRRRWRSTTAPAQDEATGEEATRSGVTDPRRSRVSQNHAALTTAQPEVSTTAATFRRNPRITRPTAAATMPTRPSTVPPISSQPAETRRPRPRLLIGGRPAASLGGRAAWCAGREGTGQDIVGVEVRGHRTSARHEDSCGGEQRHPAEREADHSRPLRAVREAQRGGVAGWHHPGGGIPVHQQRRPDIHPVDREAPPRVVTHARHDDDVLGPLRQRSAPPRTGRPARPGRVAGEIDHVRAPRASRPSTRRRTTPRGPR